MIRSARPLLVILAATLALLAAFEATQALADVITLARGRKIEGKVLSEDADSVRIETKTGVQSIARDDIAKIEKFGEP